MKRFLTLTNDPFLQRNTKSTPEISATDEREENIETFKKQKI